MVRGWEVELYDKTIMLENDYTWKDIPSKDIKRLTLHFDNRRWDLSDQEAYFVKNRASLVPGIKESFRIEERCIGYYEGAKKVHYVVDEFTGKFNIRVEDNG